MLASPAGNTAVILGSVLYKLCIQVALSAGLPANMMKLVTAMLFLLVLEMCIRDRAIPLPIPSTIPTSLPDRVPLALSLIHIWTFPSCAVRWELYFSTRTTSSFAPMSIRIAHSAR